MPRRDTDRASEIARLQRILERLHSPRLQMSLIVSLTGAAGFLSSYVLLHTGVDSMRWRYPVSVAIAYGAFLILLWFWLRLRKEHLLEVLEQIQITEAGPASSSKSVSHAPDDVFRPGGGQFGGAGASDAYESPHPIALSSEPTSGWTVGRSSSSTSGSSLDLEEIGVVLVAIAALVGAASAAVWIVWSAPALFAEILLDVLLSAGLYHRLQSVRGDHWLRTAIRRTGWPFAAVALLFGLAGAAMQSYAPAAKSVGEVVRHFQAAR